MTARLRLSVVITSAGDERTLERCLRAVAAQEEAAEIIVADGSQADMTAWAARRFPGVRVMQWPVARTVPSLRWAAVAASAGDIVACTESRMVPRPDWCASLLAAHEQWPDVPAIGGAVALEDGATARDRALYLAEYPAFIPPVTPRQVRHLTGANVAYKRAHLSEHEDVLAAGAWEPILHDRFLARGRGLRVIGAEVVLQNGFPARKAMAMRFHYGRQFAADRSAAWPVTRRLLFALAAPAIPLVLSLRLRRTLAAAPTGTWRWSSLPWYLLLQALWAAGEAVGYEIGRDRVNRIY